ncbi:MAG: response regulator transcription factor [Bifidobacteriaceae bacterium]|jgi:DNA-binding NarL/FixJ family response regulator|nr:response regulator transcription factor [Bifidobacteriaceae bacterium]
MSPSPSPDDNAIRVGIVEDEGLLRSMLTELVNQNPAMRVVGSAGGVAAARATFRPGMCDIMLMDVELGDGNGVALGVELQREDPGLIITLLSSHDVLELVLSIRDNVPRPWNYLSKRSSVTPEVLYRSIIEAAKGEVILDPELMDRSSPRDGTPMAALSPARLQVLRLVAQGFSNQAVAELLGLSRRSVENHLQAIYRELGISSSEASPRVAAVLQFIQQTARP